ncbi:MAG: DNA-deoxyinosine glycosylase [Gammaproteobacteria bacterium]|nr:DNA-deoxyinosine glycosylase [Gammaproteobacteria bacterium]
MNNAKGFPPIASKDAKVLILGSMPGGQSLQAQQYYAHPRNAFWPIMADLYGFGVDAPYKKRLQSLMESKVALWDVLNACYRPGSLDTSIDEDSIVVNDFVAFYRQHSNIRAVFFNGVKAEQLYRRYVLSTPELVGKHVLQRLPSTSPANARLAFLAKLEQWRAICTGPRLKGVPD